MKKLTIFCLVLLMIIGMTASVGAKYSEWNTTNKCLGASYAALVGIDLLQTRSWGEYTKNNPRYIEFDGKTYKVYESNPVVAGMDYENIVLTALISNYMAYRVVDKFSPELRTATLIAAHLIEFSVVKNNNETIKKLNLVNISF